MRQVSRVTAVITIATAICMISLAGADGLKEIILASKLLSRTAVRTLSVPPGRVATGVLLRTDDNPDDLLFLTNRHVLQNEKKLELIVFVADTLENVIDTLNLMVPRQDSSGKQLYFTSELAQEDIAFVFIKRSSFVRSNVKKFASLSLDLYVDDTMLFVGQPVKFSGYPLGLTVNQFSPFTRSGTIAGIDTSGLILLDADAFGGSSGSPVFIDFLNPAGMETLKHFGYGKLFVGIIVGYIPFRQELVNPQTGEIGMITSENSGLAIVVPASRIKSLIRKVLRPAVKAI